MQVTIIFDVDKEEGALQAVESIIQAAGVTPEALIGHLLPDGVAPVAAEEDDDDDDEKPAAKKKTTAKKPAKKAKPSNKVTKEEVLAELKEYRDKTSMEAARTIIKEVGKAEVLSQVDESLYPELLEAIRAASNEEDL